METFSERLQKLLKEKKIKQTHLQYIIGIKQATISTWVLGKAMPQRATMENLAKALGVTAQYLEYGDEPNTFKVVRSCWSFTNGKNKKPRHKYKT
jgi:transcriptional regulator with XRE-family HTH domain